MNRLLIIARNGYISREVGDKCLIVALNTGDDQILVACIGESQILPAKLTKVYRAEFHWVWISNNLCWRNQANTRNRDFNQLIVWRVRSDFDSGKVFFSRFRHKGDSDITARHRFDDEFSIEINTEMICLGGNHIADGQISETGISDGDCGFTLLIIE